MLFVVRKERVPLAAHRLPEHLDRETTNFATRNMLAISELPGTPGSYAIFNLRWNISASHKIARAGEYLVMDGDVRALTPEDYLKTYEPA